MNDIVKRLRETVTMLAVTPMNLSLEDWDRHANAIQDAAAEIGKVHAENAQLRAVLAEMAREDGTNARRMRAAIVAARKKLHLVRFQWCGPIVQADGILANALTVNNDPPIQLAAPGGE